MSKKSVLWTFVLCVIVLFATLLLYWFTREPYTVIPVNRASMPETPSISEVSTPIPSHTPTVVETQEVTPAEKVTSHTETSALEMEEIADAINYLEAIEEHAPSSKTGSLTKIEENLMESNQDELLQLVREGISYYDSLLESGSVDFFLKISTATYPGIPRKPSGNWSGTFEFSDSRLRGTVTRNVTQYDEQFGTVPISDTRQFAYDGETFENLRETNDGLVLERKSNVLATSFDPRNWGWGSTNGDGTLTDVINRLENPQIQGVDWDGTELYHLKGTLQSIITVELWLNPEKSYRPERHTFSGTQGGKIDKYLVRDYTYQEIAPDLWFPQSATEVVTVTDLKTGIETNLKTKRIQFSNLRINDHIPSHRFTLDTPPGTTVYDHRTQETFKAE